MKTTLCKGDFIRFHHYEYGMCDATVFKTNKDESIIVIDERGKTQKWWPECLIRVLTKDDIDDMVSI